ncbi:MAG: TonB-dependent receptor [Gammaproteobacteria bacterium]|nr:TonB-dependent receptor [Gammaproteobacteria bacterium]
MRQELLDETEDLRISAQVLLNPTERLQVMLGHPVPQEQQRHRPSRSTRASWTIRRDVTNVGFEEEVYRFGATYDVVDDWELSSTTRGCTPAPARAFEPETLTDASGNTVSAPQEMEQREVGIEDRECSTARVAASLALYDYEISQRAGSPAPSSAPSAGFGSTVLEGRPEAAGARGRGVVGVECPAGLERLRRKLRLVGHRESPNCEQRLGATGARPPERCRCR